MSRWRLLAVVSLLVAALTWTGVLMAQQGGAPGGRGGWGGRGGFDPEQFRQRMAERMKESLGATDEEWEIIGPRLEKVQELQRGLRVGGGFGRRGRGLGGPPGGGAPEAPEAEQTELQKAAEALRTSTEDEGASAAEIRQRLTDYREAREKAREDLAKAQAELLEVLTVRQEAQLVLMGVLD